MTLTQLSFCEKKTVALETLETQAPDVSSLTLLFIHGLESNKETWLSVIDILQHSYKIIALDLRGHGDSSLGNDRDFSLEQLVADIHRYVKEKNLQQFVMIAHSMGVRIAIPYAATYPERIAGLILEDMELIPRPALSLSEEKIEQLKQFKPYQKNLEGVSQELQKYGYSQEKSHEWIKQKRFKWLEDQKTYRIDVNPYVSYLALNACLASDKAYKYFEELKNHSFPVLLLKAEKNSSISKLGLKQMQDLLPALQVREVKNSSHSIHKTNVPLFIQHVSIFLNKLKSIL